MISVMCNGFGLVLVAEIIVGLHFDIEGTDMRREGVGSLVRDQFVNVPGTWQMII